MTANVDTAAAGDRLLGLDLLRGLCAITVMIYHYLALSKVAVIPIAGTYPVYTFFVLSGLALTFKYGHMPIDEPNLRRFFISRVFRIAPLYVAIALLQFWRSGFSPARLHEFVLNSTLTFGLAVPGETSITTGGWSIGIEAVFYLSFPLLLLLRTWRSLLVALVVAALINHVYVAATFAKPLVSNNWNYFTTAPTFYVYFIGGMLLARVLPLGAFEKVPSLIGTGLVVVGLAALIWVPMTVGWTRQELLDGPIAKLLILASLALVAVGAIFPLRGALKEVATFLGDVSYGTYLLHPIVWSYLFPLLPKSLGIGLRIATLAVVTLIVSAVVYRLYEKPVRDLQRYFRFQKAQPATP